MATETITCDEVGLAAILKTLAADARRVVTHGPSNPGEIAQISRRIRRVREQVKSYPPSPVQRWLDGLQRKIEGMEISRVAS
jgi:hypothetical protein